MQVCVCVCDYCCRHYALNVSLEFWLEVFVSAPPLAIGGVHPNQHSVFSARLRQALPALPLSHASPRFHIHEES